MNNQEDIQELYSKNKFNKHNYKNKSSVQSFNLYNHKNNSQYRSMWCLLNKIYKILTNLKRSKIKWLLKEVITSC